MLKDSHLEGREILSTHYRYDKLNRLIQAHNAHSELRFSYEHNRLVKEQLIHLDGPLTSGISRSHSKDGTAQITEHRYDVLGNRIQTILPTGEILNRLYYGSGHLHHINLDGTTLADIERDALHRPVERTIGKLNTQFQLDPLGRLKQQIAQPNSHNKADPAVLIGRRYQYDAVGNLVRTDDQTNGSRDYTYDALGRITQSADEHYRYDPAHNLTDGSRIGGNRLTQYQGTNYRYDPLGNLIEKQHNNGEIQHYRYNADNQLTEAEIHKPGESPVQYRYRYDPMGRRIAKVHPDGNEIQYLWDGSRLLQEYRKDRTYTYVYTEDRNYEPLAQITTYNGSDKAREILYYHNDQIGIPREMTDEKGNIVWSGDYSGWGKLTQEERLKSDVYQPFRLQNQHYDEETGLHYNFFRYYDPEIGRFTQQDPIGLAGGESLYRFANSVQTWIDVFGLSGIPIFGISDIAAKNLENQFHTEQGKYIEAQRKAAQKSGNNQCATGLGVLFGRHLAQLSKDPKCKNVHQFQGTLADSRNATLAVTGVGGAAVVTTAAAAPELIPLAARGVNVLSKSSAAQAWTSLSAVEKSVGLSAVVSGTTQIMQNGRVNACAFGVDMVTGGAGSGLTKLGSQAGLSVGSGAMSDYMCQGKSIKETFQGVPGNIYGTAAGHHLGNAGAGTVGSTLMGEFVKDQANKKLPK
ncbi:RHS repeat domain-containing protein [Neisseria subflava]|uniref:RHS repeat domain-containing protein n=1 Tax=Neisseria subflava TaxID=28449 RepID=UPI00202A7E13|nr:RHS repeat-associated core domain-containing protein [Neisseria subflava]MCL9778623.1 RHS repeat protein [Neisseria subflava]